MNTLIKLFSKRPKRQCAFLLAAYFFLASFLPLSHAHAIEEGHIGALARVQKHNHHHEHSDNHQHHGHHHDEENESPDAPIADPGSCCSPVSSNSAHHHFINELFHYASEKKRLLHLLLAPVFFVALCAFAQNSCRLPGQVVFLRNHRGLYRYSYHYCRQVSGISPP